LGLLSGCGKPIAPEVPSSTPAAASRVEAKPFEPGKADRARRAQLQAAFPELDAFFETKRVESGATGFAVGIVLEGELVYARGFGVRDVASGVPVDTNTVFRIASMTKSFTALGVLKLRDEGRLSLDGPAARYWPELSALVPPTRDAPPISLRLLLTNASGLAYDDLWGAVSFGKSDDELRGLLRGGVQFSSTPGTRYAYSNLGWALLGKVIESVSGMGYRDYVSHNILRPLGMSSSVWGASDVPAERLAIGYRREGEQLVPEARPSDGVFAPAGQLYSSLHDYARYASYQLMAYPPRDDAEMGPVRRSTLREMHEGQRWARSDKNGPVAKLTDQGIALSSPSYGMGWLNVTSCTEEGRLQHGGFEPGYFGWVVLMPSARVGFVGLSTSGPAGIASRLGVFEVLRKAGVIATAPPAVHPALPASRTAILSLLRAWDPALFEQTFDPDSARYSWNQRLRETFARLAREHGRCEASGELRAYGSHHAEFRLACERGALGFDALLSPTTPPRLQHVDLWQELMPDERTEQVARRLAQAIGSRDAALDFLAPSFDAARLKKTLQRLGLSHGSCTIERGQIEVTHEPWGVQQKTHYFLRCDAGTLEMNFNLDQKTRQLTSFEAFPARDPQATCWQ
jgi:CubicO group peptidase (beta-lactamase class C family)